MFLGTVAVGYDRLQPLSISRPKPNFDILRHPQIMIARTLEPPPGETTHWTGRAMAKAMGLAVSTVQKIWRAHGDANRKQRNLLFRSYH
jgi:hypothetical protein